MDLLIKIIEVLLANPLTVTLVLSGVACVVIAIIGEIPTLKNPIGGRKAFVLGAFGLLLISAAVGMAWISAQATLNEAISTNQTPESNPIGTPQTVTTSVPPIQPTTEMSIVQSCPPGPEPLPHRKPVVGQPWILPSGGWIIVNFWSNEPGIDQTEHKVLLGPDDPRALLGGGSAWQWADVCEKSARNDFRANPLPEISLDELRSQNLVP